MLQQIHNPAAGKLRVIGYASGSGDTLWKAYEYQKEMEAKTGSCPFEIVGVFCSKADSKAQARAKELAVPCVVLDIRKFYEEKGEPLKNRDVRALYDQKALELIAPMNGDCILLAGYVWATTDCLMDNYMMINVHPADLSILGTDGQRAYAGGDGVGDALKAREKYLTATSHLATKVLDGGPILMIGEQVEVDYTLHSDEETRFRHYLALVNEQSRMVGARTLLEVALGHFQLDEQGMVHHKDEAKPNGVLVSSWKENKPLHQRDMNKLLYPKSVAVIGASQKPGIGQAIMNNLLRDGFSGNAYAVNMRGESVGRAKGYTSVTEIPETVDLAVIATPSKTVLSLAEECGKKGVGALVCITAGFKEVGGEGIQAEKDLIAICNRYNMRFIGPNCMGLMSAAADFNVTILHSAVKKGSVALVTQSGAIGAALLDFADELGIGFSSIVSLGNQADVNVCDLLPYYDKDEHTKVIALYLESILDPVRFCQTAAQINKPILLLKSGSSEAGSLAASSHTGSLAGNDQVVDALIKKAGIIRMKSLEDLYATVSALAHMPRMQGNRVAVLTNAGGPGTLITDAVSNLGFDMPLPSDKLKTYLEEHLMAEASTGNPIDLVATAPPQHYALTAKAMMESGEYDALLICCVPPATVDTAEVARTLLPVLKEANIPVLTNFFGPTLGLGARQVMLENSIPTSVYPEQMADMLKGMQVVSKGKQGSDKRPPRNVVMQAKEIMAKTKSGSYLPVDDTYAVLDLFGIGAAKSCLIQSAAEIANITLDYPVVAKIEHPEIIHKSDVGGVRLNIADKVELETVVGEFLEKFKGAQGVFVQEMLPAGIELIIGSILDPAMGVSLMVGQGGTLVEVMKDVRFAYPPIEKDEAMGLINSLRIEPLLAGYRGKAGVNKEVLAQLVEDVSAMLLALPEIGELDLNPIIYHPKKDRFLAADARICKA